MIVHDFSLRVKQVRTDPYCLCLMLVLVIPQLKLFCFLFLICNFILFLSLLLGLFANKLFLKVSEIQEILGQFLVEAGAVQDTGSSVPPMLKCYTINGKVHY